MAFVDDNLDTKVNDESSDSEDETQVDIFSLEVKYLSGSGLRKLFEIVKDVHPEALSDALAMMLNHCKRNKSEAKAYLKELARQKVESLSNDQSPNSPTSGGIPSKDLHMSIQDDEFSTADTELEYDKLTSNSTKSPSGIIEVPIEAPSCLIDRNQSGCYLLYDTAIGTLTLQYSHSYVPGAIGFWEPGHGEKIQAFKFKGRHFGKFDLMKKCNKKSYFSGWCQFIRAARAMRGSIILFSQPEDSQREKGFELYVYYKFRVNDVQTVKVPENERFSVDDISAVACLPKYTEFAEISQVKVDLNRWLLLASTSGVTTNFIPTISDTYSSNPSPKKELENIYECDKNLTMQYKAVEDPVEPETQEELIEQEGCYLLYVADSSKLMIHYSKHVVRGAIAFWKPGPNFKIKNFKFKGKTFGKYDLVGNCTSRKDYFSGWCQFVRAAKAMEGSLWVYGRNDDTKGFDLDLYVYYREPKDGVETVIIPENEEFNLSGIKAVACLPKHAEFKEIIDLGIKMNMNRWLNEANSNGVASKIM